MVVKRNTAKERNIERRAVKQRNIKRRAVKQRNKKKLDDEKLDLLYAMRNHQLYYIKMLFNSDIKPNIKLVNMIDQYKESVLMMAVLSNSYELVKNLLKLKVNVNYKSPDGEDALFKTIYTPHKDARKIVKLLLENGANPNSAYEDGETILMIAAEQQDYDNKFIDLLLKNGSKINTQDDNGMTALMHAVKEFQVISVERLLKYDPNLDIENNKGETIRDIVKNMASAVYPSWHIELSKEIESVLNNYIKKRGKKMRKIVYKATIGKVDEPGIADIISKMAYGGARKKKTRKGTVKKKIARKHKGIIQTGSKKGNLKSGYKYSGKKTSTGLRIIVKKLNNSQ